MGRSPSCSSSSQSPKKGPWTREEDQILTEYIHNHGGHGSWRALPKRAGLNRCGKSCRLRWCNYLRPDIKRGKFSENEEQMIINLHSALGNKWSRIAAHLPGRTDNEIKNYWNTHVRKKLLNIGIDPKTHQPICDLNNFLVNFSQSMLSNSNLSANLMSSLDSALIRLKSYRTQPAADTQLLLNLWQLINSTNPLPNTIEESHSLLQSSYNLPQCDGLINGTSGTPYSVDGGTFQPSSVFQNMQVSPQFASENIAIMNSSTFFGDEFRPEVDHNNTTNCSIRSRSCSVQRENVLPALVSASSTPETFRVNQINSTFIPTVSDKFEDWEALVDNEDKSSNSFWKDFIGFPL